MIIGVLLVITFLFSACGSRKYISPEQIQEQITENLNEKYQEKFVVMSLETEETGQNFSYEIYKGKVSVEKTGEVFDVSADPKTGEIADNYAGVLYGSQIEENVGRLLEKDFFRVDSVELVYPLITEVWTGYENYKKNGHVCIYGSLYIDDLQQESYEKLENFFSELKENGYYFFLNIETPHKSAYFGFDENDEEIPSLTKISGMLEEN